jgi:hypothetical protein
MRERFEEGRELMNAYIAGRDALDEQTAAEEQA